jgi:hypothetical protein
LTIEKHLLLFLDNETVLPTNHSSDRHCAGACFSQGHLWLLLRLGCGVIRPGAVVGEYGSPSEYLCLPGYFPCPCLIPV